MIMTESTTKKMSKTMKENNDNDGQNYEEDVEVNVNDDNDHQNKEEDFRTM